jgi:hypothetical protein
MGNFADWRRRERNGVHVAYQLEVNQPREAGRAAHGDDDQKPFDCVAGNASR